MRMTKEIEVETEYGDIKKINDANIFVETDEHKNPGYKIEGIYGTQRYLISYHRDRREAVQKYSQIKCRLLNAQEKEAEARK